MEETDTPVTQSRKRVSSFFVWLFAAVGFLAALVQIWSFFSLGGSQLRVRVPPHETAVQKMVYDAVEASSKRTGFAARIVEEDKSLFCNANSQRKDENETAAEERCKDYQAMEAIFRLVRGNDGIDNYFDYEIKNVGTSVARQIRLSGKEIFLVEITPSGGDETRQIVRTKDQGYYSLPDMNPGEEAKVRVWSEDYSVQPDSSYLDLDDLPQITFEGGTPSVSMYQLAPSWYAVVNDFFSTFPLVINVLIVLVLCTAVGMGVIILIAVLSALAAGQPVKKVFEQPAPTNSSDTAASVEA